MWFIYISKNSTIKLDFDDDKPHGYYIEYQYDDIVRSRIRFSYGNFDKIYKKYYYTGNIQYEYFYNNENELMVTYYDMNGRIKYKLIKNNNIYTIYHKYACESLIYQILITTYQMKQFQLLYILFRHRNFIKQ